MSCKPEGTVWNKELPEMIRAPVDSDAIISSFVPFQSKQNQKSNKWKKNEVSVGYAMLSGERNVSVVCNV